MKALIDLFLVEPQQLERLIIRTLQFLLTCWFLERLYPSDVVVESVLRGDFQLRKLTEQLIFVLFAFFTCWFIVWILFAEILTHLFIRVVSMLFDPAKDFREVLPFINKFIAKPDGKGHINYAIIYLRDILRANSENDGLDFSELRVDAYFQCYVVVTLMLLIYPSLELPFLIKILWVTLGLYLLSVNAYLLRLQLFVNSNFAKMSLEAETLAYMEEVKDAISGISIINRQYDIQYKRRFIELEYKIDSSVRTRLKIVPHYIPEGAIYRELFESSLRRDAAKAKNDIVTLYIANLPLNISQAILERSNSSVIIASNSAEIVQRLELFVQLLLHDELRKCLNREESED
jgi:hypothetical protein